MFNLNWSYDLNKNNCFPNIHYDYNTISVGNNSINSYSDNLSNYNWIINQINQKLNYNFPTI